MSSPWRGDTCMILSPGRRWPMPRPTGRNRPSERALPTHSGSTGSGWAFQAVPVARLSGTKRISTRLFSPAAMRRSIASEWPS